MKDDLDPRVTRYLLGEMQEEEQVRLEEELFFDEDGYQQLLAVEDELRYEYAQGWLTASQRKAFQKRFVRTAEDRRKVAVAGEVLAKVREVSAERAPAHSDQKWWQALADLLMPRAPAIRFAFGAAAMALLTVGSWSVYRTVLLNDRLETQSKQLAQERARSAGLENQLAQVKPAPMLGFLLAPGLVRDGEGQKPLRIPADAGTVRLQLDVKKQVSYKTYRVEIQTLDGTRVSSAESATAVIEVPASALRADDYVAALKGVTAAGAVEDVGEYYFTVVRR
jgi:hypothetical protein